mgnify:CR=1 FL=1
MSNKDGTPNIDSSVDEEIGTCINLDALKSFFLFAGAGSGKTRSLVNALLKIRSDSSQRLRITGRKVGIITYTNAACDEIKRRIEYDSLFVVSTIHSFVWDLIKPFQHDIREWLRVELANEIQELRLAASTGRAGTKAAIDREEKIRSKSARLSSLDSKSVFTYSPTGNERSKDSLNHAEVIKMAAYFLMYKPLLQQILVCKFPILFVDESQDTKKEFIEALFTVEKEHARKFSLGLFGDTMQRIYSDGKADLGTNLPDLWRKPIKKLNYRCPKRVIELINNIRSQIDKQIQLPGAAQEDGVVRLFIVANAATNKSFIEESIVKRMSEVTRDDNWEMASLVKKLTLEHHMAASRMGFIDIFYPLYQLESSRTSLIDGTLPGLRFFTQLIIPLVNSHKEGDNFELTRIVKQYSPLLSDATLRISKDQSKLLTQIKEAVFELLSLWDNSNDPSLLEIANLVSNYNLFTLPTPLNIISKRYNSVTEPIPENEITMALVSEDSDLDIDAWETVLKSPFSQIRNYNEYVSNTSPFGTHQGVKGLEFPRVMVILDDDEARGFLFSYEKLFGVKQLSQTDLNHIRDGGDNSFMRTLRLFYVACSRAEKSLAVVAYTADSNILKSNVIKQGWFMEDEIEFISGA